eukprot:3324636-Prymnesium_polylepis.1
MSRAQAERGAPGGRPPPKRSGSTCGRGKSALWRAFSLSDSRADDTYARRCGCGVTLSTKKWWVAGGSEAHHAAYSGAAATCAAVRWITAVRGRAACGAVHAASAACAARLASCSAAR